MMDIATALNGVSRLLLDTAPIIYLLEGNAEFGGHVYRLFRQCKERGIVFVTTPVTLAECLVHPLARGDHELVKRYENAVLREQHTEFWPIDAESGREAARLRAQLGLQLADALQVAVALRTGCDALLTNDSALSRVTGVRILQISEIDEV